MNSPLNEFFGSTSPLAESKSSTTTHASHLPNMPTNMGRTFILIASVCALSAVANAHAAGRVFYDGFETGNTSLWGQDDFHNRCQVVTVAADGVAGPYAGSRMVRCNWDGIAAWDSPARYESLSTGVPYTNEFLLRTHLRVDRNLEKTGGSATKIMRFFHWSGVQATYLDLFGALMNNSISNQGVAGGKQLTTYWGGLDSASNSASWHKVEYYINQSAGTIKVWHDGVLIRNNTGFNFGGAKWTPFFLVSNWEDAHDGVNFIYFDDVEIFSDTGTGASGSLSDASVSASGSLNLRVTGTAP
jgi:hypothetical protein